MEQIKLILIGLGIIILGACIFAIPTYLLWNWLMPEIFSIKEITFIQAIGVNIFTSILFKPTINVNQNK